MPKKTPPHVVDVAPGRTPLTLQVLTLQVRWQHGGESLVDTSGLVGAFRVHAPLRENQALFRRVHVGEHGTDVAWTDEIDIAADTLWRLAQEQSGKTLTAEAFCAWQERDESNRERHQVFQRPTKPGPHGAAQIERFKESARALGCDKDKAMSDEKLKSLARRQPRDALKEPSVS